jgi:hypothetical protein
MAGRVALIGCSAPLAGWVGGWTGACLLSCWLSCPVGVVLGGKGLMKPHNLCEPHTHMCVVMKHKSSPTDPCLLALHQVRAGHTNACWS